MTRITIHLILLLSIIFSHNKILAQDWELTKEKDGIRVYDRVEEGSKYNSFKGETDIHADFETICALIEDVESQQLWDEDIEEIRILTQDPGKLLRYYVVYKVPWPFTDRDLCVEATITLDQQTGAMLFDAWSIPEAVPPSHGLVRIVNFWQKWTIQPKENGMVHLTIEGFADPAGNIPAWITNLANTSTPFRLLKGVRDYFE